MDICADKSYNGEGMKLDLLKDTMKAYGLKPLAEDAEVSRTSLYNLMQGENFEGETLEKVCKVLGLEFGVMGTLPNAETVSNHLAYYGAPLFFDKSKHVSMSLEEVTKWGLKFAKDDGLLDSLMPFFLLENFKSLNKARLLSFLDEEQTLQLLGYYLELASKFSNNKATYNFANSFFRKDFPELYLGKEKLTERTREVMNSKSNSVAKKWNVLTLGSMEDYFDRFRKWKKVV